jgi:hypothetical protein
MEFGFMLNLFQYHSRHAEFISVSALWVVKDEILKQVQDDGAWLHTDGVLVHTEFISVSTLWVVKDEILKQVQDDGIWVHTDGVLVHADGAWVHADGAWVHAEFISVSFSSCWIYFSIIPVMLNLFQYLLFELLRTRSWNKFRMTELEFMLTAF